MPSEGAREASERRVLCGECKAPVWTTNRVWVPCDVCGAKIWIDRSPDYAPDDLPSWLLERGGSG